MLYKLGTCDNSKKTTNDSKITSYPRVKMASFLDLTPSQPTPQEPQIKSSLNTVNKQTKQKKLNKKTLETPKISCINNI